MALINDILNRLKEYLGVSTDAAVARSLGVKNNPSQYISVWRKRGTIPLERLLNFCGSRKLSIEWVLTGKTENNVGGVEEDVDWKEQQIVAGLQGQIASLSETVKLLTDKEDKTAKKLEKLIITLTKAAEANDLRLLKKSSSG